MPQAPPAALLLRGQNVAFTGKLAALSRAEAETLVRNLGGTPFPNVTDATTLLVIGAAGWPLRHDGRLTKNLVRARFLARLGHPVEMLDEDAFLRRLGQPDTGRQPLHSLSEVVVLLKVSGDWIRAWVRGGLLLPHVVRHDVPYFTFAQVARMRSLCKLLRSGVTTARLHRSLHQLKAWMPEAEALAAHLTELEGELAVRLEDGRLLDVTGQFRFDFDTSKGQVLSFVQQPPAKDAATWFAEGCELEEAGQPEAAANAYRQTLLLGGPAEDACFNLANVLTTLGQSEQASERYRQVLELNPQHHDAWTNLGNLLADAGRLDEAMQAYQQALAADPHATQARYNLADLLDRLGRTQEAKAEWKLFLRQEAQGPWADFARRRLGS